MLGGGGLGGGRLGGVLQLSDEQKSQLQALRTEHQEEMQALRQGGDVAREDWQAMRDQHRAEFQAILSDEQRAAWEQARAEREANRPDGQGVRPFGGKGRRGGGRGGPLGDGGQSLGLSEDQQAAIGALRDDLREQMQALRASGETTREQAQAIMEQHREQVHALLTDEQKAQIEAWRAQRPERRGRWGTAVDDGTTTTESAISTPTAIEEATWGQVKAGRSK